MKKLLLAFGIVTVGAWGQQVDSAPRSLAPVTFANLGTPADGTILYCSDCTASNPAAGSGTGAMARRENGAWNSGSGSSGFSGLTSGTNTSATMTVGAGGTITYTSTGIVNASQINGTGFGSTTATAANLLLGDGTKWVTRAMSGDVTIGSTGVTAIGATKVTNAMLAGSIASSKLVGTDIVTVGTITTGTWSGTAIAAAKGGTGVANTATLTLGSSNQNWATLATGIVKNTTTTGALSAAASADVYGLWSGSCSSSTFLRGDGACATPAGSISGLTTNKLSKAASSTTIADSSISDDGTTVSTAEALAALSGTFGAGGGVAGVMASGAGTLSAAPTSSVGFVAPTSVATKFLMTLPGAPTTGFVFNTGTSDPSTLSFINLSGDVSTTGSGVTTIGAAKVAPAMMKASTVDAQTDAATITWAIASVLNAQGSVTLGGNRTLNITNPVIGGNYWLKVTQDGTGTRTLTGGTGCTWWVVNGGGGVFNLSTAAGAVDLIAFTYDGTHCLTTVGKNYN